MSDNYETPAWLIRIFDGWYDPCPLEFNGDKTEDGLKTNWPDKTYVNPPYSNPLPWVEKAIKEASTGKRIVMLLRADTSTKYFSLLFEAGAHIFWSNSRIRFIDGKPANFPSMLVIL